VPVLLARRVAEHVLSQVALADCRVAQELETELRSIHEVTK
jgi:hypothetical protein